MKKCVVLCNNHSGKKKKNNYLDDFIKILKEHDELCIDTSFYDDNDVLPVEKELNVLYEDEYLLIVDKTANCIIYPDDLNIDNTMANYVSNYYFKNDLNYKIRHAHRLDYETTGVLVYAKDVITHAAISKMIEEKTLIFSIFSYFNKIILAEITFINIFVKLRKINCIITRICKVINSLFKAKRHLKLISCCRKFHIITP